MKEIINFGNCQSGHIAALLTELLPQTEYHVTYFSNNERTGNKKPENEILKAFTRADIIIFQPLKAGTGIIDSEKIKNSIKETCLLISYIYLFNNGIYSLCHAPRSLAHTYGKIHGEEIILNAMREQGKAEILRNYKKGNIDFQLLSRFDDCMKEMKEREKNTDIKLTCFIENNYRDIKLFNTHNHPTNSLMLEILRQIKQYASLPIDIPSRENISSGELPETGGPVSPYDVSIHGYQFKPHDDWFDRGKKLIELIIDNAGVE